MGLGLTFIRCLPLLTALLAIAPWQVAGQAAGESEERSWLGVYVGNLGKDWSGGAFVARVVAQGPAAAASIRGGDVIVAVDAEAICNTTDLACLLRRRKPGDTVSITLLRTGARHIVTAKLGRWPYHPESPPRPDCADAISGTTAPGPAASPWPVPTIGSFSGSAQTGGGRQWPGWQIRPAS
jgi:membrane-associated protease RseP (regulator of RpoE activity)